MNYDNLPLEIVKVTESAAIACLNYIGKGDKIAADGAAVDALRLSLNKMNIKGKVVIGEGEMDEAPMLYIGEEVGTGQGIEVDIALDPLEGTVSCVNGMDDSLSVISFAEKGNLLNAPDIYMDKIAVGVNLPDDVIDIKLSPKDNILSVAEAMSKRVEDMTICTLRRPRHDYIVNAVRSLGASIKFIDNGDIGGILSTALDYRDVDLFIGKGGAPEGVIAAAALRCTGGQMQAILRPESKIEIERCHKWGIMDLDKVYTLDDLARGNVIFCVTGVTDGYLVKGVHIEDKNITTETLVMCSKNKITRRIITKHNLNM